MPPPSWNGDTLALASDLRRAVRGAVRFDDGSRALYSTDASSYRQVPIGAVVPVDAADVEAAVAVCRRHGAPLLGRGGGTSLAGQACNTAVVLDFSRHMTGVVELDPRRRIARVLPGTVLDDLRGAAAVHGLTFGPDPATHAWCTLGGMIGNNACGTHSLTTGRTADQVEELEILTYDGLRLRAGATSEEELARIIRAGGRRGEIYSGLRAIRDRTADLVRARFPQIPRRVSGFNLDELLPERGFHVGRALAGTEGTCVTILEATVRLVPRPAARALLVLGYPDVFHAADHVLEVLEARPYGLEGMDRFLVENEFTRQSYRDVLARLPEGNAWLLAEFGGEDPGEAEARARHLMERLARAPGAPGMLLATAPREQARIWEVREAAVGTTSHDPRLGDAWPGWEDSAVPPARLAVYLRALQALLGRFGYGAALYGHFGEGCIHARINFDLATPDGVRRYRSFMEEAADLVVAHGGSLSGEHGDGQARGELLSRMFGAELVEAFRDFKAVWDPANRMNPGKVVDPRPLDADLRLARPLAEPVTAFRFPDDDGRFSRAALRCVGVGKCRREESGVMCPSWRVTHDERHSTRGRARLLFEMLNGETIRDGWRSAEVREALDLCLACKGCKVDCPAGVDMASYKAEFLSHFYQGRPRPIQAYAMGLSPWWARLGAVAPDLVNALTQSPGLAGLLKTLGGIAPGRAIPALAPRTFRSRFASGKSNKDAGGTGKTVLLWPDTFTNYFHPEIGTAAVDVLAAAGFRVTIPRKILCCGRPLYDFGMLDLARRQLRQILDALRPEIRAGLPLVVLEPSCAAVFRDELLQFFPTDGDARRLANQTVTLAELLVRDAPDFSSRLDHPRQRALIQPHCHHHAVMGFTADRELLSRLGLDAHILDGCCGMAGAFGFSKDHYDISLAVGEQALLPAVRAAGPDDLILADGFSCRTQIAQATGRRGLHLAEVMVAGLHLDTLRGTR
jgi:FAD/FMN-containing dehydrogenase/Fe-S oxidoreductase